MSRGAGVPACPDRRAEERSGGISDGGYVLSISIGEHRGTNCQTRSVLSHFPMWVCSCLRGFPPPPRLQDVFFLWCPFLNDPKKATLQQRRATHVFISLKAPSAQVPRRPFQPSGVRRSRFRRNIAGLTAELPFFFWEGVTPPKHDLSSPERNCWMVACDPLGDCFSKS